MSSPSPLARREFIAGLAAGIGVGLAIYILEKLQRRGGAKNPLWGRASVRQPDAAALAAAVGGGVPRQPSREGVQRQVSREKMVANNSEVPLPAALLKKHPKGCGVDLHKVDSIRVTDVYMLPVARLSRGDAPVQIAPSRTNTMGDDGRSGYNQLIDKEDLILGDIVRKPGIGQFSRGYLRAGPRKTLYFEPKQVTAAIVTCGGLCPGLNNIVRHVTKSLLDLYGAKEVYGVRGGWWGFHDDHEGPLQLTHDCVSGIHHWGGTILGSARGGFDLEKVFAFCAARGVNQLYVVGGDGTHRAANKVGLAAVERKLDLSVAGIPKTIDNDLDLIDRSFGFNSAVAAAQDAIKSAKTEARCNVPNGIGVVKLMGRHAGFIAAHATLASGDVDLCLIPEVKVELDGKYGILGHISRVLEKKGHAVVVVAEGAGEELVGASAEVDAGGNRKLPEIGPFIKDALNRHFKAEGTTVNVKYIDPSYMIRSVAANASDSLYCMLLAQNAVHGAMAGYTCFTTGMCCARTVFLPIPALVENSPRMMDKRGRTWERVISVTGQPNRPVERDDVPEENAIQPATVF